MGCDGGTIPKRNEIVKNKQKTQCRDKDADMSAKWQYCSLSGLRLKKPIVACQLGRLYNKFAIIEHLLDNKSSKFALSATSSTPSTSTSSKQSNSIPHIRSLKDVKELNFKERLDSDNAEAPSSSADKLKAPFICPISGLELNGKYKFYYLLTCGCVFSERALKQVPNEKLCIVCSKSYNPDIDLIVLNGDKDDINALKQKISIRKKKLRSARRTTDNDNSSLKRHKPELGQIRS